MTSRGRSYLCSDRFFLLSFRFSIDLGMLHKAKKKCVAVMLRKNRQNPSDTH